MSRTKSALKKILVCKLCSNSFYILLSKFNERGTTKYCSKECRIKSLSGKNNPLWKGGDWKRIVINYGVKPSYWSIAVKHYPIECSKCLSLKNLNVHHKDGNRKNNNYENLIFLCRSCHNKEHNIIKNLYDHNGVRLPFKKICPS